MSPEEAKGWVDIVVAALGVSGLGGIIAAIIGAKKAAAERPPVEATAADRPSIGRGGMIDLAGMMAGEHFGMELLRHLATLAESIQGNTRAHEHSARVTRECSEERRADTRRLAEQIDGLSDRIRDMRPSN